jgi:hypothetical protein
MTRQRLQAVISGKALDSPEWVPFTFNPIHDIESLWWLAVWSISRHVPTDSQVSYEQSKANIALFERLQGRPSFLRGKATQDRWTKCLPPSLQTFARVICEWSTYIVAQHQVAEFDLEKAIDCTAYRDIAAPQFAVQILTLGFADDIQLQGIQIPESWASSIALELDLTPSAQSSGSRGSKRPSNDPDSGAGAPTKKSRRVAGSGAA